MARLLIDAGADVDAKDENGKVSKTKAFLEIISNACRPLTPTSFGYCRMCSQTTSVYPPISIPYRPASTGEGVRMVQHILLHLHSVHIVNCALTCDTFNTKKIQRPQSTAGTSGACAIIKHSQRRKPRSKNDHRDHAQQARLARTEIDDGPSYTYPSSPRGVNKSKRGSNTARSYRRSKVRYVLESHPR